MIRLLFRPSFLCDFSLYCLGFSLPLICPPNGKKNKDSLPHPLLSFVPPPFFPIFRLMHFSCFFFIPCNALLFSECLGVYATPGRSFICPPSPRILKDAHRAEVRSLFSLCALMRSATSVNGFSCAACDHLIPCTSTVDAHVHACKARRTRNRRQKNTHIHTSIRAFAKRVRGTCKRPLLQ